MSTDERSPKNGRRTQAERSATTQSAILEATLECLVDLGYARTTTSEVVERAGVSRGAMLHHYPDKASLVAAAVAYLVDKRIAELREALERFPQGPGYIDAIVDHLWELFSSPSSQAVLEITLAARTDPELFEVYAPLARRYEEVIAQASRELFADLAPTPELFEEGRRVIFHLLQGLALAELVREDDRESKRVLAYLKQGLALVSAASSRASGSRERRKRT
ncbi:TetR/AcrR family transcriptional regulator [Sandaracinus amylolyticus]|uniref:TetR/AcrR family transcriptional regulator n=1 Tax=Sandaracinus amylolyticus TaxID=927083 RepID=UPI001F37928F|nr:TetR/AcrR family transcriptional regulator [Sandaracinus amylolyticus]UJR81704.1 DNA-binding transcriptional regulator, AcrR family [Sandaracinus amylolyticus]